MGFSDLTHNTVIPSIAAAKFNPHRGVIRKINRKHLCGHALQRPKVTHISGYFKDNYLAAYYRIPFAVILELWSKYANHLQSTEAAVSFHISS